MMKNSLIAILFVLFFFQGNAQKGEIACSVRPNYERPIVKEQLHDINTLSDMNSGYPASWIGKYISVVVSATYNGETRSAKGLDDKLTPEQMNMLKMADMGTDIVVHVEYYPNISLEVGVKEIDFALTVAPQVEASFHGGDTILNQYFKEHILDKIPKSHHSKIELATATFSVSEAGKIVESQLTKSTEYKEIDNIILDAINDMPAWQSAENGTGEKVKQAFVFSIGNMIGC